MGSYQELKTIYKLAFTCHVYWDTLYIFYLSIFTNDLFQEGMGSVALTLIAPVGPRFVARWVVFSYQNNWIKRYTCFLLFILVGLLQADLRL